MKLFRTPARTLVKALMVCGFLLASGANSVFGFDAIFTIDNIGNAYFTSSLLSPHTQATDPASGLTTLQYTLPFAGTAGDVLFRESATGSATDLLRFDGNSHVYFFSTDGIGTPAYVPVLPAAISPSQGPFTLQLSGGQLGYQYYSPTSGQPGYNPGTIFSVIVSVPEPGTLAFGALGGVMLLLKSRRESKRA
jgi:hypothetical protein